MERYVPKNSPLYEYYKKMGNKEDVKVIPISTSNVAPFTSTRDIVQEKDISSQPKIQKKKSSQKFPNEIQLFLKSYYQIITSKKYKKLPTNNSQELLLTYISLTLISLSILIFSSFIENIFLRIAFAVNIIFLFSLKNFKRNKIRKIHKKNVTNLRGVSLQVEKFVKLFKKGVNIIVEMELIFKGFKLSFPYPPIARIELQHFDGLKCLSLRKVLFDTIIHVRNEMKCLKKSFLKCEKRKKGKSLKNNYSIYNLKDMFNRFVREKNEFFKIFFGQCVSESDSVNADERFIFFCNIEYFLGNFESCLKVVNANMEEAFFNYIHISNKFSYCKDKIFVYEMNKCINEVMAKLNLFNERVLNVKKGEKINKKNQSEIVDSLDKLKKQFISLSSLCVKNDDEEELLLKKEKEISLNEIKKKERKKIVVEHNEKDSVEKHQEVFESKVDIKESSGTETQEPKLNRNILKVYKFEEKKEVKKKLNFPKKSFRLPMIPKSLLQSRKIPKLQSFGNELSKEEKKTNELITIEYKERKSDSVKLKEDDTVSFVKKTKKNLLGELNNVLKKRKSHFIEVIINKKPEN